MQRHTTLYLGFPASKTIQSAHAPSDDSNNRIRVRRLLKAQTMKKSLRNQFLALVLIALTISSALGFFTRANAIHQRPSPSPDISVTKFRNQTIQNIRQVEREQVFEALQKANQEDDSAVNNSNKQPSTLRDRIRNFFFIIGGILYSIKASCAVIAIRFVLNMKLEGPVLRRLPPNILLFLLEVSIHRPEVIYSVARELGERISSEVCMFTGKEAYEVGDITKTIVARYTGKEDYRFGDLTQATISRYKKQRTIRKAGSSKAVQVQKEGVNVTSVTKLHKKFQRKKNTKDLSSEEMETIIFKITGKKDYEFGDVTKAVLKRMNTRD